MAYEVETDLIVHCKVKVRVEADDQNAAIDIVSELLPQNYLPERSKAWKAKVELKAPNGVNIRVIRAYHFEQASGSDKARKVL